MNLSIIIPVYQVEKYIRPCLESVFKQGLDETDFEVIIVNDGTKDRSMEMIADIISIHHNITIINQENQGLSMARNNALEVSTGEYIMFIDSDDLLISNSVPYLLDKALSSKAELVVADFLKMTDDDIASFNQEIFHQKDGTVHETTGKDMLILPLYSGYFCVWHTLFKRDFLNKNSIRFIPHIYFEDNPFTLQCYAKADRCLKVNWLLNIYRIGHSSITTGLYNKKKGMDHCVIIVKTWELSQEKYLSTPLKQKLQNDAYFSFSGLFYKLSLSTAIQRHEFVEVVQYLKQLAPDLSFQNGIKQRIISWFYRRMPSVYTNLRFYHARYLYPIIKQK